MKRWDGTKGSRAAGLASRTGDIIFQPYSLPPQRQLRRMLRDSAKLQRPPIEKVPVEGLLFWCLRRRLLARGSRDVWHAFCLKGEVEVAYVGARRPRRCDLTWEVRFTHAESGEVWSLGYCKGPDSGKRIAEKFVRGGCRLPLESN